MGDFAKSMNSMSFVVKHLTWLEKCVKCLTIDPALFKSTVLVLAEVYMDGKHISGECIKSYWENSLLYLPAGYLVP